MRLMKTFSPDAISPVGQAIALTHRRPPQVLVLGVVHSLTWAVARCLARAGSRPVVLGWPRISPLGYLPDCKRYVPFFGVKWINDELDPDLAEQIDVTCDKYGLEVVIGADYDTTLLLARSAAHLKARVCPVPDAASMRSLHDKWQLSRLLDRLGLPYPPTELIATCDDLTRTALPFPIITKPVNRWASLGFQIHHSPETLARTIEQHKLAAPFPLLAQQFIPGVDVGISFFASRGRLVAYSMFEQTGNGDRRFYDDPRLLRHIETLLLETGYNGVGQVDTRYDPRLDEFFVLELNPRFWASLLYAMNAGVNYPELLVGFDRLSDLPVRTARLGSVSLPAYERTIGRAVRLSERLNEAWYRFRDA